METFPRNVSRNRSPVDTDRDRSIVSEVADENRKAPRRETSEPSCLRRASPRGRGLRSPCPRLCRERRQFQALRKTVVRKVKGGEAIMIIVSSRSDHRGSSGKSDAG